MGSVDFPNKVTSYAANKKVEILKQPLHTAVSMNTLEFEEFAVDEGLHITINLKDFKVPHLLSLTIQR